MTIAPTWPATHTVPAEGMAAYATPDPATAPVARLDPHLRVHRLERRGDWMHVVCANGWTTWVDGRLLVRAGGPAEATPASEQPAVAPRQPQPAAARSAPWPPWLNPLVMLGGALAA